MNKSGNQLSMAAAFSGGHPRQLNNPMNGNTLPQDMAYSNLYADGAAQVRIPGVEVFKNARIGYDPNPQALPPGMDRFGSQVDNAAGTTQLPMAESLRKAGDSQAMVRAMKGMNTSRIGGGPPQRA